MDPKDAVIKMIKVLEDHPNIRMIEYDSKETGTHVKVERLQPQPREMKLPLSPN